MNIVNYTSYQREEEEGNLKIVYKYDGNINQNNKDRYHHHPYYYFANPWIFLVIVVSMILIAWISKDSIQSMQSFAFIESINGKTIPYGVINFYKYTIPIANGTAPQVFDFIDSYISSVTSKSLGCQSVKLQLELMDGIMIQFIDSSMFTTQSGRSLNEWTDYISSLGYDDFNVFMHNKVQLYVNNLQPLYDKITTNRVSALLRLSESDGAVNGYDLAHITIPIPYSTTFFDIMGPSSSISSDDFTKFQEFSEEECVDAHHVHHSLHHYELRYDDQVVTDAQSSWMSSTGLYTPMLIQVTMPISSIQSASSTLDMVSTITKSTVTYKESSTCSVIMLNNTGSDETFETPVLYVANDYYLDKTELGIADWENDVIESHSNLLSNNGWDHFMDNHLAYSYESASDCSISYQSLIDYFQYDTIFPITTRQNNLTFDSSTHIFAGVNTVMGFEISLEDCVSDITIPKTCGCTVTNNDQDYYVDGIQTECQVDQTAV